MFIDLPIIDVVLRGLILTTLGIIWIVILVRVNGLRSFSKMTNFDFVVTVAIGSLLASASQSTNWLAFTQVILAMATLFFVQYSTARLRKASDSFETLVQNKPIVLMRNGEMIEDALVATRVARDDVIAKLREANVLDLAKVRAVVLETTGDISVLHGDAFADELLQGTKRVDV